LSTPIYKLVCFLQLDEDSAVAAQCVDDTYQMSGQDPASREKGNFNENILLNELLLPNICPEVVPWLS
jgi:hypothetical protein